jgi:nitrate/nitrite transporter NarK
MVLAPSLALLASWFGARQLGLASAVVSSGAALALVTTGPTVPLIIAWGGDDGWRWAWYAFAAVAAFMGVLAGDLHCAIDPSAVAAGDPRNPSLCVSAALEGIVRSRFAWHLGTVDFLYMVLGSSPSSHSYSDVSSAILGFSSVAAGYLPSYGGGKLILRLAYGVISDRIRPRRALAATMVLRARQP